MRYLFRRLGFYLVALWAAITINFLIPRLAPGNPAQVLVARMQGKIDPRSLKSLEEAFGITNASLWQQYVQYLGNLIHGNLGLSITYFPTPVVNVIAQDLPWTLGLFGVTVLLSFAVGTLIGTWLAWRRGSWLDSTFTPLLTLFSAVPYFWLALVLLYVLGFLLKWFPLSGGYDLSLTPDIVPDYQVSILQHAILPAFTVLLSSMAGWVLGMRNSMVSVLNEDYVLMAQAKGLTDRRVMFVYAARNALLPNITSFALALGFVVGGALLTEMVFSYPGIGFALYQAVQNFDYSLIQGIFLLISIAVLGANFLADLIYIALDPRIRQERK